METILRVQGVDPGSAHVGCALLELDLISGDIDLVYAKTLDVSSYVSTNEDMLRIFNARNLRHRYVTDWIIDRIEDDDPHLLAVENAFFRKFPQPYRSLIEGIVHIQNAVYDFDPLLPVWLVEPSVAKAAVGSNRFDGNAKEIVYKAIRDFFARGIIRTRLSIDEISEHAIDAIAIAFWALMQWLNENDYVIERREECSWYSRDWMVEERRRSSKSSKRGSRRRRRGKSS